MSQSSSRSRSRGRRFRPRYGGGDSLRKRRHSSTPPRNVRNSRREPSASPPRNRNVRHYPSTESRYASHDNLLSRQDAAHYNKVVLLANEDTAEWSQRFHQAFCVLYDASRPFVEMVRNFWGRARDQELIVRTLALEFPTLDVEKPLVHVKKFLDWYDHIQKPHRMIVIHGVYDQVNMDAMIHMGVVRFQPQMFNDPNWEVALRRFMFSVPTTFCIRPLDQLVPLVLKRLENHTPPSGVKQEPS
jgi:hypothetical protein